MIAPQVIDLVDATVRRRKPTRMAWSWGEGLLLDALLRLDAHLGEARYQWFAESYFAHHAARAAAAVRWSDECPPGLAALELYTRTRRAEHRALAEAVARYVRTALRTRDGGLNHFGVAPWSRFYPQSMWVDSLMMYGVFAARFGRAMNDEELMRFAAEQPALFARVLRDPSTRLFRHAFWNRSRRAIPAGPGAWLRGNGWVLASLVEVLDALPPAYAGRHALVALLGELAPAVVRHQLPSGLFPTVLGRRSYAETSGSALVAYALLRGVRAGHLPPAFEAPAASTYHALLAALDRRRDGVSMTHISAATMPYPVWLYGLIPRVRDAPYGIAALIFAAIAEDSAGVRGSHCDLPRPSGERSASERIFHDGTARGSEASVFRGRPGDRR